MLASEHFLKSCILGIVDFNQLVELKLGRRFSFNLTVSCTLDFFFLKLTCSKTPLNPSLDKALAMHFNY